MIEEICFMAEKKWLLKVTVESGICIQETFCFKLCLQDLNFSGQRGKYQVTGHMFSLFPSVPDFPILSDKMYLLGF